MGKGGASSCFKIMACGRDPDGIGEEETAEEKMATDKRKWSFRRRSSKNQILSNISISEPLSVEAYGKGSPEAGNNDLNDHTSVLLASARSPNFKAAEEKSLMSTVTLDPSAPANTIISIECKDVDASYQESSIIVIQSAARRYLAYIELVKLKNVVKLQAVLRGYLVRRQAVGTLRCVQAIVKLQGLIRSRAHTCSKKTTKFEINQAREDTLNNPKKVHHSTEKLQASAFTRQLLASTSTKRPIYISCDASKSASAWNWLERWMTLSSSNVPLEPEQKIEFEQPKGKEGKLSMPDISIKTTEHLCTKNTEPDIFEGEVTSKSLLNRSFHHDIQDPIPASGCESHEDTTIQDSIPFVNTKELTNGNSCHMSVKSDSSVQIEGYGERRVVDIEKSKRTMKRMPNDTSEGESNKSVVMPKRSCNPAFVAVQSKFEELTAVPNSVRSLSGKVPSFSQVTVTESKSDSLPHMTEKYGSGLNQIDKSDGQLYEATFSTTKTNSNEIVISHQMQLHIANSECGTEISISSTLDSPDRSEAEGGEIVLEIGTLERRHFNSNGISDVNATNAVTNMQNNSSSVGSGALEGGLSSSNSDSKDLFDYASFKSDPKDISSNCEKQVPKELVVGIYDNFPIVDSMSENPPVIDSPEQDVHVQQEYANAKQLKMSSASPDASPRSHITALESHGTPASQTSEITRGSQVQNTPLTKKPKVPHAGKTSLSTVNSSGGKNSSENLQKDLRNGKRRNSLGMVKSDFFDHEPRNSSSNALPNYMQATESAKAKLHAGNSPKSSPDIHDKESHTKKRHSLPVGNGKQSVSPRMERSASKVQQSSKENTKRSPKVAAERKWQR